MPRKKHQPNVKFLNAELLARLSEPEPQKTEIEQDRLVDEEQREDLENEDYQCSPQVSTGFSLSQGNDAGSSDPNSQYYLDISIDFCSSQSGEKDACDSHSEDDQQLSQSSTCFSESQSQENTSDAKGSLEDENDKQCLDTLVGDDSLWNDLTSSQPSQPYRPISPNKIIRMGKSQKAKEPRSVPSSPRSVPSSPRSVPSSP